MTSLLRIAVACIIATAVAGCGPSYACSDTADNECEAGIQAAEDVLPPGYISLPVGAGVAVQTTPVVACYPDGSAIVLELVSEHGDISARPFSGDAALLEDSCP